MPPDHADSAACVQNALPRLQLHPVKLPGIEIGRAIPLKDLIHAPRMVDFTHQLHGTRQRVRITGIRLAQFIQQIHDLLQLLDPLSNQLLLVAEQLPKVLLLRNLQRIPDPP